MLITVTVTKGELWEMDLTEDQLTHSVIEAMDTHRDYAGFNVVVNVVDWDNPNVFTD